MASDGGAGATFDSEPGWGAGSRVGRFYSDYASPQPPLQMLATTTVTTSTTPASAVPDREPTAYGAGGRLRPERKRTGKRSAPYERPATGRHAAAGPQAAALRGAPPSQALVERAKGGGAAWLGSEFSRIIANGATYVYSSIFRRQLAPPLRIGSRPSAQPIPSADPESSDADDQVSSPSAATDDVILGSGQLVAMDDRGRLESEGAKSSQQTVEDLWKKKTLSREEFESITALLQSRVVSSGAGMKQQPRQRDEVEVGPSHRDVISPAVTPVANVTPVAKNSEAQNWRRDLQKARGERESNVRALTIYENGRSSSATPRDAERMDSLTGSPVEVAIAFMGGRAPQPSGATPAQSLNQREETRVSSRPAAAPNASQTPSTRSPMTDVMDEDQLRTPTPSSIYPWGRDRTIFRTPYSRPERLQPPKNRAVDGTFGTPSVNRWTPIRTPVTGGREMLKRRSTVLDEGWSHGGPIRRIRHKSTIPGSVSNLIRPRGSPFQRTPFSTPVGNLDTESPSPKSAAGSSSEKDALVQSGNYYVPAQSSATARKILETLEKMTPSPKGKALGEELAIVRGRPVQLTEDMLNDQARMSMAVVDLPLSTEAREPSPSSRIVNDLPAPGVLETSGRIGGTSSKGKGEAKSTFFATENGPSGLDGTGTSSQRARTGDGFAKLPTAYTQADFASSSAAGKTRGFHMSATFEESGSEDEGRTARGSPSSPLPNAKSTLHTGALKTSTVLPPIFPTTVVTSATATTVGSSSVTSSTMSLGISKPPPSSGFTFPTRAPVEGPPTPKPMFPATTPPPATGTPFFQFGKDNTSNPGAFQNSLDHGTANAKEDAPTDAKSEFSFGPSTAFPSGGTAPSKLQVPPESKAANVMKSTFQGPSNTSATTASVVSPAFSTGAATNFPMPRAAPRLEESTSFAASSAVSNTDVAPPSTSTLSTPSSNSIFGSSSVQGASSTVPINVFAGSSFSPFGASFSSGSMFGSGEKTRSATSTAPSLFQYGQANIFPAKPPSTKTVSSEAADAQPVDANDDTRERPQKRPLPSFHQDAVEAQSPPLTTPAPAFASSGASAFGASATAPATANSFAAGTTNKSISAQSQIPSSFGQASSAPQPVSTAASSPAASSAFTFGASVSTGGTTSTSLATGFGNNSSFPPFSSPAFGSATSGSTFGLTATAPMSFGSSSAAPSLGSAGTSSTFGGFGSEAAQTPSSSPFMFSSPSPASAPAFAFGSNSSPAFSFGSGPANSSGSPFTFGSSPSFPFAANNDKTGSGSSPATLFGTASSVPAFGSTTNGSISGEVLVNEQTNMDDNSMADAPSEPTQTSGNVFGQPSMFGEQPSAGTSPFVFGSPAGAPNLGQSPAPVFGTFAAPSNPPAFGAAGAPNPFAPGAGTNSLEFGGGGFALGSGGDRPVRKIFKAKRTGAKGRK